MLLQRVLLLSQVLLASAKTCPETLKATRDSEDPLLIHISRGDFEFANQFLSNDDALKNAPPETATNPKTPGTITKRNNGSNDSLTNLIWANESPSIIKFEAVNKVGVIGATVTFPEEQIFYGVWEYPFNQTLSNNVTYDVKGLYGLKNPGTDWASGRAPFFFTRSGFGFYVDTNRMGRFKFDPSENSVTFAFNATDLDYYVFTSSKPAKLLEQFGSLSNTPELPATSGFGPIIWNNDWNVAWPEGVTNAEQHFYHFVDQLYYNEIRATAMFADRESNVFSYLQPSY